MAPPGVLVLAGAGEGAGKHLVVTPLSRTTARLATADRNGARIAAACRGGDSLSTAHRSTARHSTARHSTVRLSTARLSVARPHRRPARGRLPRRRARLHQT